MFCNNLKDINFYLYLDKLLYYYKVMLKLFIKYKFIVF